MRIAAIIPARMASTRFPGKPLADICGLPMIEHVRRRVNMSKMLDYIIVATCDKEIYSKVTDYGGKACMTSDKHERCTERIAEASKNLDVDLVINIQGDEPMIHPNMIDGLVNIYTNEKNVNCINLISPINKQEEFNDPNVVKTVFDKDGFLLYYSRSAIPSNLRYNKSFGMFKQLGIIGFSKDLLNKFVKLEPTPLEKVESVDMLRLLEHGYRVRALISNYETYGVDTINDLKFVEKIMCKDSLYNEYKGE